MGKKPRGLKRDIASKNYPAIVQERARVVKQIKDDHPGVLYSECVRILRRQLGIGKSAAEQAMACYHQELREWMTDPRRGEEFMAGFARIARKAESAGQYGAAASAWAQARDMAGLSPTQKIEHSGTMGVDLNMNVHLQALKLTPAQRKQRREELIKKAEQDAVDEVER